MFGLFFKRFFSTASSHILTKSSLKTSILNTEYVIRISERKPPKNISHSLIELNTGNPHMLGQPWLSFNREVLASCMCPSLLDVLPFHQDVKSRAKYYL